MARDTLKIAKKNISKSDCFLSILTKNYVNSEICYKEYKIAHKLKKKIFSIRSFAPSRRRRRLLLFPSLSILM